ncbi:unnamed protein product [Lepeophtheirus salmonis]|uniref:(salmon louse) hypothetical protein n=1 Tax=Lepeophtheirus salmonis TaxID=72036 RepID=A0A7R8CTT2_LEPSM|nr:unnamed protein product [Lepeophtheirus salmonis]CAF2928036.1 unnamed protein product [Lepeophtheirus salmonis]
MRTQGQRRKKERKRGGGAPTLQGLEYEEDDLKWHWYDDSGSALHSWVVVTPGNETQLTYTLKYESSHFEAREYQMDLRVFRRDIFGFWSILVESSISFSITEQLNGHILVPKDIVSSVVPLNLSLSFHDPHAFLGNATELKYFWAINDTNYGPTSEPFKIFNMATLGFSHFTTLTVASFATNNITKYGNFSTDIIVRDPINSVNATGDLWLKHNQILDLNMKCVMEVGPGAFVGQSKVRIIMLQEMRLVFIQLSSKMSVSLRYIASLLFRLRLAIETADFDFSIQDDHNLEYRTFWERLRDSMLNAFGNASDDVSHISSSNSSSHGGSVKPPVGIHYGSIS